MKMIRLSHGVGAEVTGDNVGSLVGFSVGSDVTGAGVGFTVGSGVSTMMGVGYGQDIHCENSW